MFPRKAFSLFPLLALLAACGGGGPPAPGPVGPTPSLQKAYPLDGSVDWPALEPTSPGIVTLRDPSGAVTGTTTVRHAVRNDDRHVYVAVTWDDPTWNRAHSFDGPLDFDGVAIGFDQDGDGLLGPGEDQKSLIAATVGSLFVDQHGDGQGDAPTDEVGDGLGSLRYDLTTGTYTAEFLIPITDDSHGEDGPLGPGVRYQVSILEHVDAGAKTGRSGTLFPGAWARLPWTDTTVGDRPRLPTALEGTICFISTHENPLGDVYVFVPATGKVTRATNTPLYKDGCSLSHDRNRIAFFAAPDKEAYSDYEVYVVNVDGSGLKQLTDNAILDGHPAWSPDDTRIAYASFRGGAGASIVVMTEGGTELVDLTPDSFDDNDPDYLPDGRIVFKTNRFGNDIEVRIAVMDPDGTNVVQLSRGSGWSDHDPVSDGSVALFERLMDDRNFATEIETRFRPWNLVEARVDGSGERTLRADGWVNWLPIADPSGRYIAYLRSAGYTALMLMTARARCWADSYPTSRRSATSTGSSPVAEPLHAPSRSMQHFLYLRPLPHGHGSLRPSGAPGVT